MTSLTSKVISFFVFVTLLLVGGAYLLSDTPEISPSEQNSEQSQAQQNLTTTTKDNSKNEGEYIFSRPGNGTLIKTQRVEIKFNNDNSASATIPINDAANIKKGQKVILQSKEGIILPLGGTITDVNESEELKDITISLPKLVTQPKENNGGNTGDDAKDNEAKKTAPSNIKTDNLSNKAKIITLEGRALQLFPLSALQHDENGTPYVWEVNNEYTRKKTPARRQTTQNQDGQNEANDGNSNIIKRPLSSVLIGDKYFRAGRPISAYTYLVINPNTALTADITAEVKEVKFKAPIDNPIREAYRTLRNQAIKQRLEAMAKATQECKARQGKSSHPTDTTQQMSNSCGQEKLPRELSPEELFDSILSRRPKYTGGKICNGCPGSNP